MRHRPITHLRHVGLAVPGYRRAVEFYRGLWGLEVVAEDSGVAFLGTPADPEQYVLRLRQDDRKRLDLIAFAARSAADVDLLAGRLGRAGVRLEREPGPLDTPGGGHGLRFFDLDGRLVEVSAGVAGRPFRELEERESIPRRLSHVVLNSTDVVATKAFYERHLGFLLSDWLAEQICFLRSGPEHHVLAISRGPHASLNHVSFELRGLEEYMRGSGRLMRAGHRPLWGPGRHGPGDNTFTYFADPAGNVMEYTTELARIEDDEAWRPRRFGTTPEELDQWGTAGLLTDAMIPAMYNDPDEGLWRPSPV
ncbi:VOC family protein [Actinomadura sp. ATCC 31491]|uniref:VOC family protein n=1 Tax=Actinomadura luzonensis TaxID=2805427 RepID=A0ABT0G1N5_9ACTN|nr:VOC family protein [Actinomadura luzonensis]MCK2218485.1 VOC family protein [Actinomadura luzonensis]